MRRVGRTLTHHFEIEIRSGTSPDAAAGSALGDATTTLFLGRSGRGKTTAAMLGGLDSAFAGTWVPLLDLKGDAAGVSAVAAEYGVPTAVIEITAQFSGAADLLRVLPADDALLQAPSQLMLLLPPHLRGAAEAPVMVATARLETRIAPGDGSGTKVTGMSGCLLRRWAAGVILCEEQHLWGRHDALFDRGCPGLRSQRVWWPGLA